jgi:hypothetical protein
MFSRLKKLIGGGGNATGRAAYDYRKSIYTAELGEADALFSDDGVDNIEILAFARDFSPVEVEDDGYVLLTSGMSDRCMKLPPDAEEEDKRRAELMWYVREPTADIIGNLRWLARYPFIDDMWLGFGHRMPMPEPIVFGCDFKTFLFLTPIITPDKRIAEALSIDKDEVEILTVNLISDAEYRFIQTNGLNPFLDLLDENDHPPILDLERKSYV